jgi:hypothetical protein
MNLEQRDRTAKAAAPQPVRGKLLTAGLHLNIRQKNERTAPKELFSINLKSYKIFRQGFHPVHCVGLSVICAIPRSCAIGYKRNL